MSRAKSQHRAAELRASIGAHVTSEAQQRIRELLKAFSAPTRSPASKPALATECREARIRDVAALVANRRGPLLVLAHIGGGADGVIIYGEPGDTVHDVIRAALARPLPPGALASATALWRHDAAARVLITTAAPEAAAPEAAALEPMAHVCRQL